MFFGDGAQFAVVHQFGKPDDAVQRRAQFVRHAGQEAALGLRGGARGFQRARQLLVLVAQLHRVLLHLAGGHLGQVALRHVEQRSNHAGDFAAVVVYQALAHLHRDFRTVLQDVVAGERRGLGAGCHSLQHGGAEGLLLVGSHEVPGVPSRKLIRRTLQQAADRLVEPPHKALAIGFFEGDGRAIEQVAVAGLAFEHFAFALAQQVGGVVQLARQRRDFIRAGRERVERKPVRQPPGVFFHRMDAPHHAARHDQVHQQRAQRTQHSARHHRAEQPLALDVAQVPRGEETPLLLFREKGDVALPFSH